MNDKLIVGLDIGTTKICALAGRRNENGKIEILGTGKTESYGVLRGVVANLDKTTTSIKEAIKQCSESSKIDISEVYVGIAGQHIKSKQHRGSKIRSNSDDLITEADIKVIIDDMHKLAMVPGEEIIHVIPQEFIIDGEDNINEPVGHRGTRLEAKCHIITGLVRAAEDIKRCVGGAGLSAVDLILEPIASSEAVLVDEEKEAGVVLVDIGGGTTDLAIFLDGVIRHTAVIPFGGNIITEDIKEGCSILKTQAEKLKVGHGSAMASQTRDSEVVAVPGILGRPPREISMKNLSNIIQARMEEIIELVHHEILSTGLERKLSQGIVITGGGAQLKNIQQLFELITGMTTRIGYPHQHLAKGRDEIKNPMYATAVGLVMMGLNDTDNVAKNSATNNQDVITIPPEANPQPVENNKKYSKGSWFKNFVTKGKELLSDDTDEDLK